MQPKPSSSTRSSKRVTTSSPVASSMARSIDQFNRRLQEVRLERRIGRTPLIPHRSRRPVTPRTKAIMIESIANPGPVVVVDIAAIRSHRQEQAGVPLHCRQHPGLALPLPPEGAWRRRHRPLPDQVHGRTPGTPSAASSWIAAPSRLVQIRQQGPDADRAERQLQRHGPGRDVRRFRVLPSPAG